MPARILVVEDNRDVRTLLRIELSMLHEVIEAPDGLAGWKAFEEKRPDLVVTDLGLPGLNGLDLCARIRAHPERGTVPVIILTGAVKGEELDGEVWRLGTEADLFLEKPVGGAELRAHVDGLLRKAAGFQPLPPGSGSYEQP